MVSPRSAMRPSEGTIEDVLDFINAFEPSSVEDGRLTVRMPLPVHVAQATPSSSSTSQSDDDGSSIDDHESELLAHSEQLLRMLDRISPLPVRSSTTNPQWPIIASNQQEEIATNTQEMAKVRRRNTYREKMRYELDYLRTRAAELEDKLASLRGGTLTTTSTTALAQTKRKAVSPLPQFSDVWTRIARNQLETRLRSEAENQRLKMELQLCVDMTRSLSETLSKRPSLSSALECKHTLKRRRKLGDDYAAMFTELTVDLDANFARTDAVLHAAGVATAHSERDFASQLITQQLTPSGEPAHSVELAAISSFPFQAQMAGGALWRSLVHTFTTRSVAWQHQDDSLLTSHGVLDYQLESGATTPYPFRTAAKKFIDAANRWVIVWRSRTDFSGDLVKYYADESGWAVVEPLAGPVRAGKGATLGSLCRSCIHFVHREKQSSAALDADAPEARKLTDLVTRISAEDCELVRKMMESLLLDEVNAATNKISSGSSADTQPRRRR